MCTFPLNSRIQQINGSESVSRLTSSSSSSSSGSSVASSVDVAVTVDPSRMTDVGDASSDRAALDAAAEAAAAGAGTTASFDDDA